MVKKLIFLAALAAVATSARAQPTGNCSSVTSYTTPRSCADSQTTATSGTVFTIQNNGGLVPTWEELITGSPATVSIVIKGCGPGGTCDTLDTYTTVANAVRAPTVSKFYTYYTVTPSWTGGTSPTVTVNTAITSARLAGSGGGGSGTVTSVALVGSGTFFSTTPGTAVTSSGNLNVDSQLLAQTANCFFAGPTTGSAATPSCRALVNGDFPNTLAPTISAANFTNFPTFNQNTTGTASNLSGTPALPNGTTATTQTTGDTTTKLATDAFVANTLAAPPAIGNTTPAAISATSLNVPSTGSQNVTLSSNSIAIGGTSGTIEWTNGAFSNSSKDTGFDRSAAGIVEVNTGSAGSAGSIKATGLIGASYQQTAASSTGGTCTMSTGTSCTITIGHTYTTPVCIATLQSATVTADATGHGCTVSGTTVTITAGTTNSSTWGAFVFGNPN